MDTKEQINQKFDELLREGRNILNSLQSRSPGDVNNLPSDQDYFRFRTEALNLIKRVCGEDSVHYQELLQRAPDEQTRFAGYLLSGWYGIVEAAKRDFDDDFLADIRNLVRADLLDDFLSQAEMLLREEYHVAAASLAGAVLEDTLRKLCDKNAIPYLAKTKIDALNVELAKKGVYDKLVQKEITAKADLRNNADHGHFDKVKPDDVADMVKWVRRFAKDYIK